MQIIKKSKHSKKIIASIIVALLIAVAAAIYLFPLKGSLFGWSPIDSSSTYKKPSDEQLQAGKDIENRTSQNSQSGGNPNAVGSDQPQQPQANPGDTKATVNVAISAANQNDGIFQIRTLISTLVNDGTCMLTLTKSGKTVTKTAGVQALTSSSTCKGFDIPVSELSEGNWSATFTFENTTLKGSSSRTVTVLK